MATKTRVILVDDIDNSVADETVKFGLDGLDYEIDLNREHAEELRNNIEKWVKYSRRIGGRRIPGTGKPVKSKSPEIRKWAAQNGYSLPNRGRIPSNVVKAYYEQNK